MFIVPILSRARTKTWSLLQGYRLKSLIIRGVADKVSQENIYIIWRDTKNMPNHHKKLLGFDVIRFLKCSTYFNKFIKLVGGPRYN